MWTRGTTLWSFTSLSNNFFYSNLWTLVRFAHETLTNFLLILVNMRRCMLNRVTRKHWPLVQGPPPLTGSVDYLRTGPWTTPMDPSTDHLKNKIKNKNHIKNLLTACPINRSLVSAKFRAFLRWSTLGKCERPGFSLGCKLCHCRSLHLYHFRCCGFAWKTRKPNRFVISFPSPFCLCLKFRLAKCEKRQEREQAEQNGEGNGLKVAQISRLPGDFPVFHIYL